MKYLVRQNKYLLPAFLLVFLLAPISTLHAETLKEAIAKVLDDHDRILAAKADLSASKTRMDETFANSWAPTLTTTTHYGHERRMSKASAANTDMESRELDFSITQRVWDWGQAFADVEVTRYQKMQMEETLDLTRQALVLDAISSYYNLDRTQKMVSFASKSADNIKRQGEVEDIRVSLGKGYSADVLQVKTQLAGAEARLVQAKGALLLAENHIKSVFLRSAEEIAKLEVTDPDYTKLPDTVEEVVQRAIESNPQVRQLGYMADMMGSTKKSLLKSTFFPTLNAVAEHKFKDKVSGVDEFEDETLVKFEITFPLNLGLSGLDTIRAAGKDTEAAKRRYGDMLLMIEEQARSAWSNLHTARANAALLNSQADLAEKFLELAREERKLDKRTLLDVLNGETALINARSDAASAEADVKIAFYTLMQTMGALNLNILE
ncbi:MAG: TolC family protein [Magnetococcales bacterium]|nr:TolC family protein [Magnetococcales bacterium]